MSVKIPHTNPLRLRPNDVSIDYVNRFPRLDLMTQRTDYQKGVQSNKYYYIDWIVGELIQLQMHINFAMIHPTARLVNAETGVLTAMSYSNITPVGWIGYPVYKFMVTPATSGDYYISIYVQELNKTYTTDTFHATSTAATEKKYVDIRYQNSYNKDGMVWTGSYYNIFFTGILEDGDGQTEKSISKEDDGVNIYNDISYSALKLTLAQVHETQLKQIRKVFACDDILVNGIRVVAENGIEKNKDDKTDLYNVVVNLTLRDIDDFANFD